MLPGIGPAVEPRWPSVCGRIRCGRGAIQCRSVAPAPTPTRCRSGLPTTALFPALPPGSIPDTSPYHSRPSTRHPSRIRPKFVPDSVSAPKGTHSAPTGTQHPSSARWQRRRCHQSLFKSVCGSTARVPLRRNVAAPHPGSAGGVRPPPDRPRGGGRRYV